ncbi:GTP pyrophosphokinase [Thiolapillus brandeum]|uniref:guanosine-3',5'-bis(diphosphate) 3'-diphosphatase n=1 Tax=Thiolapillus brandeum TaxID=1076588 RepID=A0A7U6JJG6_9GAMM|nr:GTP pyrophosphokinase [Thiolapillus brandeum]
MATSLPVEPEGKWPPIAPVRGSGGGGPRYLISDLCTYLESYLPPEQVREVYRAYLFGAEAHKDQKRLSGEPYICHPVAVARILAEMRMDYQCLMAAILHDVIEDTPTAKDQLAEEFSEEIAELVDGVSKLARIGSLSRAEAQAESFRKMMLAMTRDIRVILIKLADRLHNMRTLGVMRPDKARRISRETTEIYAPIAQRLGINSLRVELEDLGMAAYYPWRYRVIDERLQKLRGHRRELVNSVQQAMRDRLDQEDFKGEVSGREKHICSIYRKMRDKHLSLGEVADVFAFRILVKDVDTCYRVLGAMHSLYKPVPGRFKDYIAIPKANGYQSLHTVLVGPHGQHIEVQIRTNEMHQVAEEGIAAHWHYKTGDEKFPPAAAAEWVRNLLEVQKGSGTSTEFLEHVKVDLFPDEVYVFTPNGQIKVLPKGASVVDFAYAIHSDVGNHCVAARVDRHLVPLRTRLRNGQTVQILTNDDARPNPAWLDFVVTGKARAGIRTFLKRLESDEAAQLGQRMLERELEKHGAALSAIKESQIQSVLEQLKVNSLRALMIDIGLGNRMVKLVTGTLLSVDALDKDGEPGADLTIRGTEGMVVKFGNCCHPIPGDPVIAVFNPGKGLVVHHQSCPNVLDEKKSRADWVDVRWEKDIQGEFDTALYLDVNNKRGMLATIASAISEMGSNIDDIRTEDHDGQTSGLHLLISVSDRKHLAAIMRRLRAIPEVLRISRDLGRKS